MGCWCINKNIRIYVSLVKQVENTRSGVGYCVSPHFLNCRAGSI